MKYEENVNFDPKMIIFDCDGVLVDSEIIACDVDAQELTKIGYPISAEDVVRRFAGVAQQDMHSLLVEEAGIQFPNDYAENLEKLVMDAYRTELKSIEGVADTVRCLSLPYCIASSSKPSKLALGLIETGLFDLFYPYIYSSSLVENGKPAPDLFLYAAEKMSVAPESCIVVEDSVAGVVAAKAAGMTVFGFVGGAHCFDGYGENLTAAGATLVFDKFSNLLQLIDSLTVPTPVTEAADISPV